MPFPPKKKASRVGAANRDIFYSTLWSEAVTDGSVSTSNRRLERAANLPPRGRSVVMEIAERYVDVCFVFWVGELGWTCSGEAKKNAKKKLFRWKHAKVSPGKGQKNKPKHPQTPMISGIFDWTPKANLVTFPVRIGNRSSSLSKNHGTSHQHKRVCWGKRPIPLVFSYIPSRERYLSRDLLRKIIDSNVPTCRGIWTGSLEG